MRKSGSRAMKSKWKWSAVILICVLRGAGTMAALPENEAQIILDEVWNTAAQRHYDADFDRKYRESVYEKHRPEIVKSQSRSALIAALNRMLRSIGESHLAMLGESPAAKESVKAQIGNTQGQDKPADGGFTILSVPEGIAVHRISDAVAGKLQPGDRILAVDGVALDGEPDAFPPWSILARGLLERGAAGSAVSVTVERNGAPLTVELIRRENGGSFLKLGHLPRQCIRYESEVTADGIGIVRFSIFAPQIVKRFRQDLKGKFKDCRALIVDLRGNPGGILMTAEWLIGWMVPDRKIPLGTMTVQNVRLTPVAAPQKGAFNGALAVLVDRDSCSTSEMFAAALQDAGAAKIFGEKTPGWCLPSQVVELSAGYRMQVVMGDAVRPDGKRLEGVGVTPDQIAVNTVEILKQGRDLPLDAALEYMRKNRE